MGRYCNDFFLWREEDSSVDKIYKQLLHCLRSYACGSSQALSEDFLTVDQWNTLFQLAVQHKLDAVVYSTMGKAPGFFCGDQGQISLWRQRAYALSLSQSQRTARLLRLTGSLDAESIPYAVLKGIICRSLYRNGDLRISADEDILIRYEDYTACAQVLEQSGFSCKGGLPEDVTHWYDDSGLHIELHTRLCEEPDMQACFTNFTPVRVTTDYGTLLTMTDTFHLAFLVYHARKHLITGGVGIRTFCDIALFYQNRKSGICTETLNALLETCSCKSLFYHILSIGQEALGIPCPELSLPPMAEDLLEDVLDAGIYGQSSLTRRHSGTLTAANHTDKQKGILHTLFPSRAVMEARYPKLKDAPYLLPLAWCKRLGRYGLEVLTKKDSSPAASLQMGKKRMEMLVRYDIISKNP